MDPAAPAAATGARRPLRLVQLQLQAFKSYGATPTTIKCASANGLTALVGKNGCGKSAVADAILWVLGETGSFIRTTATAHLVNRQCAASGAPICMFAKLCLQTDGGDTANNGDDDDPSAALLAAAQFFSVGKTYDGKKSTLRLETFADADFAQQPLSTTVITYGVLRKLLQSFGVDIKLTSRFIISQDAIGRTLSQKGSALLQHVERVIGTWQTYHDHTNQLKQVIADLSGKCVALFEDTHNKTADFGQLEDELQPVFQAFRQCQRAHSLGNDISTAAHEAVRAATASHEAHTRELNDARQAVTQLEAGVHSHSAALSTATDELAAAQQNKAGLKRSLSRVVKKIGALEGAILQHQEDRKRHTAQATVLGPRRLKKYAKTQCGLQAEHRRLTTEYTGAKQEAAALGADGGATSSATGPDHSPSPKKSRRRSSGGTTTTSSSGNGTGGGGAAAVGPVTELQIAMAELSVQTTEQQLSKLNSTARAAEQAAQANARHAQLQDKLRCVTSAALAEDGKLAQLQQELQQCVRLRDSLNDQIRQRRDAGGSSSAMLQLAVGHLSSSQRKRAHTNTSPRAAAVAAVTDNVSVFGSIAQVATCASLHAYVPLHLVLRHALLNDIVVEHRAAAICVSGHFRDQRIGRVTCHILNETARSSCAPAALAHRNTEALSHMADFVKCDAKFAGVISKLLGKWMYCASLDAALGYLRQHPTFSGSIATGCGALCFSGGREIRRFTAAQVSGILQSLFANQAALPLDNPPQLAASDESRSACACASSSRQSDRATNAHPDDLEGAVKACDLKQLQLLGVQRVTREQKARLDEEQRDLTASCAALEKQAESTECPAPLQKERTVAQRKRFVMQLAAQREHVQELREAWQAQLAQVPKAEQLREQCLELENALELNDFKQRDVFKKQRSTEETIVAATQAAARLQGQVVVAEASLGRQQALQEQYAASLDDAQLHIDASLEARDQLSADHRKQVAQLKSLSASVDTLDAESAKFTEMITAAKSTAARHRAHMQSLRRMHHKLQPAFQILSMPKPRKFVAINRIGVTSQDPDVDDGGSPLQDDQAAAAHDLVDKLDTFAEQLSACTRQASALMDHRLAQLVLCYSSIVDLRKQAATVSQRLQSNRRERSRLQAERFTVFKQAVDHVNDHLQGIFEQLCAFGSARLNIAIDSPDVFDLDDKTDVPLSFRCKPGRHCTWQSFHALSGGQKALCAVALTLALQRVYPCPFYVLDEIDSALDSVKVSNLARLLVRSTPLSPASAAQPRAFSSAALSAASSTASGSAEGSAAPAAPSQFIVLTHKAEMYEQAALIVGVFQREDADGRVDVQPVYLQPSGGGGGGAAPGAPSATPSDAPLARDQPCSR